MGTAEEIRVLHVDDEPDLAELTAEFLEREDDRLVVETATGGPEALDRLETSAFDCVVSDYDMPGMDGIELLEAVRAEYPALPFVLYTGKGSEEIASEAIVAGVTDYLQKGTDASQYAVLANRIANAVATRRSEERASAVGRVRSVLREVDHRLVRAEHRPEIETGVCRVVADTDPYRLAWIGAFDRATGRVEPRARAGDDSAYLAEVTPRSTEGDLTDEPAVRAARRREPVVVQSIDASEGGPGRRRPPSTACRASPPSRCCTARRCTASWPSTSTGRPSSTSASATSSSNWPRTSPM